MSIEYIVYSEPRIGSNDFVDSTFGISKQMHYIEAIVFVLTLTLKFIKDYLL